MVHQARLELDAPLLLGGMPALRWMPAARCAFECTLRHDPPQPLAVHAEQLAMRAHASQLCSKSQAVQEPALALVHFMAILRVSFLPAAGGMTVRAHEKSREQQSERERWIASRPGSLRVNPSMQPPEHLHFTNGAVGQLRRARTRPA